MKKERLRRNLNLDFIRCTAVLSVLSVHFFLNSGFYAEIVDGKRMFGMVTMRTFCMICVPLFMILSGYLLNQKQLTASYYTRIIPILTTYVLCSILCIIFKILYKHENITFKSAFLSLFNFTGANYSWYINMYIGLFLMIPFLNIMWNHLPSRKEKLALLATLCFCTTLTSIFNIFDWITPGFWKLPSSSNNYQALIPDWWTNIYPLFYYFIGAFLKENPPKIQIRKNIILIIAATVFFGIFNYYRSYQHVFIWDSYCGWYGFETVTLSVLCFSFLLNLDLEKIPELLKDLIYKISELSLGIYLVSFIFDSIFYPILIEQVPNMKLRFNYMFLIVGIVFFCSAISAQILNWIGKPINRAIYKLIR